MKRLNPLVYLVIFLLVIGFVGALNRTGKKMLKDQKGTSQSPNWWDNPPASPISSSNGSGGAQNTQNNQNTQGGSGKPANDFGAVGAMGKAYLQGNAYRRLVVEIDSVTGKEPSESSTNELLIQLQRYADKPDGVATAGSNSLQASKNNYSAQDLFDLAKANRSQYSSGSTASLYVLFVNGSYTGGENILGVALNSSFIVIFKDRLGAAATALVFEPEIERAVLIHEMGHALGLVNLTYKSKMAHEDAGHQGHSSNSGSVMYWAVEDVSVANILRGGPPYQFDSADQDDIARLKTSEY
jgi:hypothetical protein